MLSQLKKEEYNPFYVTYINSVEYLDIIEGLLKGKEELINFLQALPEDKWTYAYDNGKWTVAEVFSHMVDTERIFAFRALCLARNEKNNIMGFDHDEYVKYANANNHTKEECMADFEAARNNTISLYKSFSDEMLVRIGETNGSPMSARALGYIISGHQNHHLHILKERYL